MFLTGARKHGATIICYCTDDSAQLRRLLRLVGTLASTVAGGDVRPCSFRVCSRVWGYRLSRIAAWHTASPSTVAHGDVRPLLGYNSTHDYDLSRSCVLTKSSFDNLYFFRTITAPLERDKVNYFTSFCPLLNPVWLSRNHLCRWQNYQTR